MKKKNALKTIMKERGINQAELAKELGITPSHLCKVLKGQRRLGINIAIEAAKISGIPLEQFFV